MKRFALLLLTALFLLPAVAEAGEKLPGLSLYQLQSGWTTQDGKPMQLEALRGTPIILSMIYTGCPDVCPLIAEAMQQIEADLPKGLAPAPDFVLVSFDAAHDTPQTLKAFAKLHRLDGKRWTLLHGDENAVRELAAALDVSYRRNEDGTYDHTVAFILLDADGVIAYRQAGFRPDTKEFVAEVEKLYQKR